MLVQVWSQAPLLHWDSMTPAYDHGTPNCQLQVKVVNAGADAALAESLPQRLHTALRRHPEAHALVLLLGTNDILARLHPLPHHLLKLQARPAAIGEFVLLKTPRGGCLRAVHAECSSCQDPLKSVITWWLE